MLTKIIINNKVSFFIDTYSKQRDREYKEIESKIKYFKNEHINSIRLCEISEIRERRFDNDL